MRNAEFGFRELDSKSSIHSFIVKKIRIPQSAFRNYIKVLSILCITLLGGCGYQMVGKETHVPPGLTSVAIPTFVNRTLEPGIEVPFTQGFLGEFINDRRVGVVDRREAASILEGVIKSFSIYAVAYGPTGVVSEYQTTAVIDLTLKKGTGEVLWTEKDFSENRWYRASPSVLASEANKAAAIQEIGRLMAERIRNRFFYNF
jgi:outer membrane lipopolysaccharide assembly protein LptE/RlpB